MEHKMGAPVVTDTITMSELLKRARACDPIETDRLWPGAMGEMVEALVAAEIALDDLGACPNDECTDPACAHALPKVRAIRAKLGKV